MWMKDGVWKIWRKTGLKKHFKSKIEQRDKIWDWCDAKSMTLLPTPQPTLSSVLKLSTSVWSFSGVRASRQGPSLHSSKAAAAPWQESPPLRASLETFRWRSLIPSPQDLEQGLHPSHSVHWQSTKWKKYYSWFDSFITNWVHTIPAGHSVVPQACDSEGDPWHTSPPFRAAWSTILIRRCVPPPHVAEQLVHGLHALQVQLTVSGEKGNEDHNVKKTL